MNIHQFKHENPSFQACLGSIWGCIWYTLGLNLVYLCGAGGVPRLESRLAAAAKAGYDTVYLPVPATAAASGEPSGNDDFRLKNSGFQLENDGFLSQNDEVLSGEDGLY